MPGLADLATTFLSEYSALVRATWEARDLPRAESTVRFSSDACGPVAPGKVLWASVTFAPIAGAWRCPSADAFAKRAGEELALPRGVSLPPDTQWEYAREWVVREAIQPLVDVYRGAGALEASPETIRRHWEAWERDWRDPLEVPELLVPLLYVDLPDDAVALVDHVRLERLTPERREALWDEMHAAFELLPLASFARAPALLRVRAPVARPKRPGGVQPEIDMARRAIRALRLAHDGEIVPVGALAQADAPSLRRGGAPDPVSDLRRVSALAQFPVPPALSGSPDFRWPRARPRPVTPLTTETLRVAAATYADLTALEQRKGHGGFTFSLRRFDQVYERESLEDMVVDLTISLEASLLADVRDELRFRAALRGAALLASAQCPADVSDVLRRLYDVRSAIVHSGVVLAESKELRGRDPGAFVAEAFAVVRQILRAAVTECAGGMPVAQLGPSLDAKILTTLKGTPEPA